MELIRLQFQFYYAEIIVGLCISLGIVLILLLYLFLKGREARREATQNAELVNDYRNLNAKLSEELTTLKVLNAKLATVLKQERLNSADKIAMLDSAKEKLSLQFQKLAQQIFDEKSQRFSHENKERVSSLLKPLQEQLHTFQRRIDTIQRDDIRERTSLKEEIFHLRELNQQINREAVNLTRALQGDKKTQGNWGELILEKVLEKSGLRKGQEYTIQSGFRNRDNQLQKPDVIVHLPDNRDVIIDSKVSLISWERYVNSEDEKEKQHYLSDHVINLRNHIKNLGSKDYSAIQELRSLDFVLLFIPIDSSYVTACQADEKLFTDAYEQRIIIVTPTTLLATLKTVENLWRYEQQSQNSKEIADRAGAIYDKLCGFLEEMEKVGKQLATCTTTYESALNKLARGRGNLISQANKLTELGVKAKKKIPQSIETLSDSETRN